MKIKAMDLEGAALDWSAAKAEGWDGETMAALGRQYAQRWPEGNTLSTDWRQGGLLIERHQISITCDAAMHEPWEAELRQRPSGFATGSTPLVAAMRALVAAELGYVVDVPDELTTCDD